MKCMVVVARGCNVLSNNQWAGDDCESKRAEWDQDELMWVWQLFK
jgi:hypothetical protein